MREQLVKYVDLLFAGASNAGDIKQEILQNTLDRYDDLISQGKSPEAAYRLAISGIGDINEILGNQPQDPSSEPVRHSMGYKPVSVDPAWKKILRAVAIGMYIISPIPLFVLGELGMDVIGLCGTLGIVAVATMLIVFAGKSNGKKAQKTEEEEYSPQQQLRRSISSTVGTVTLIVYLLISFATGAWHITWVIFPLSGAVKGLIFACIDLKEATNHEK